MTSPGGAGAGGPLIAGAGVSGGDFHEYSDDDFGACNLLDFPTSPDTLQSRDITGSNESKSFLNPQHLTATPFPDSPTGSYRDSSSESASSSNRTRSSDSSKTPVAATMGSSADVKMDWEDNFPSFIDEDDSFSFGREANSSAMQGLFPFGEQDDGFVDRSFEIESASSSPDAQSGGRPNVAASPVLATFKADAPEPSTQGNAVKKSTPSNHRKRDSQYSTSSSGFQKSLSREVSPMSAMMTSHKSSPAAPLFNNSPSPLGAQMNGNVIWTDRGGDVATPFGHQVGQPMSTLQRAPVNGSHTPSYKFTGGYELRILPTPLKSRVETQIPIKIRLTPLPIGVTKLHLPTHTISKPKLLARPSPQRSPDTLELYVSLVCTSAMENGDVKRRALERAAVVPQGYLPDLDDERNAPQNGGDVRICNGCITRERKRAARKKIKKPEEEKIWSQDEERRVIVFNTQEVKEWQSLGDIVDSDGRPEPGVRPGAMQVDAPMRIACYCRHHSEKMGFNVIFTIKDFQDRVIAQAMSNPIMITDDHKTHPMAHVTNSQVSEAVTSTMMPAHISQPIEGNGGMMPGPQQSCRIAPQRSSSEGTAGREGRSPGAGSSVSGKTTPTMSNSAIAGRNLSRPSSPSQGGPAKKRKSSNSRVPNGLTMTRLDTSPPPGAHPTPTQLSAATSPFSPNQSLFPPQQPHPEQILGALAGQQPFSNGPPTPVTDHASFFSNRSASMENLTMAQLYSAPTSNHASRAPSPNGLRNSIANGLPNQFTQALAANPYLPLGINQTRPPPVIHKIIPNEGPTAGGIEVTVLGAAFYQGLEVWFGGQKATTTTYWGDSSLVCLLPPSPVAGTVAVTFKQSGVPGPQAFSMGKQPSSFKYVDDNEDKLIRTALSVLGQKMSGQMVDVSDLARRILSDGSSTWVGGNGSGGGGGSAPGPPSGAQMFNDSANSHEHLESQLLKCLDLIDLDDSTHKTRLDFKRVTGHTMLHLACSLGYHRFVAALLARGANPDARDRGGFTPLHMAAIQNHPEIVRRLMLNGSDPTIRSLSGLTAADVARSRDVLRAIRPSERHARSRSGGSIRSRTSSAASLRSLWEPMTRAQTHEEPICFDSGEESPEYTPEDLVDESSDEEMYLPIRRRQRRFSTVSQEEEESSEASDQDSLETPASPGSSTAAMAGALRDQVQQQLQQFQQSMTLHLQNIAHLPHLPTISGMAMFPDYQAYLHRMQQLVPGMSGPRPGPAGVPGETHGKVDGRWWGLGSYMSTGGSSAPPPAYDDIFPTIQRIDCKQESAICAAAEAEADLKCAAIYDEPASASKAPSTEDEMAPEVLKIGRKNAITKAQQEQFLRARETKLKSLGSDRNLFFIWIPLLLVMVCAMLYSYFPSLFPLLWTSARALVSAGHHRFNGLPMAVPRRVMEAR